ncbi:MAG: thioredoxin domain-containing protein [bacterium]
MNQKTNKLINEKNPYLLQHVFNPVNWFPWGREAFELAERENKPIFLSIGYSTCHWCHVMAHESFEDSEIAEMMNDAFVNIKVDREERPDIDSVYMQVCQMLTGGGGWPLTVIMTPDKKPFFAGTYFPKDSVANRIGMRELIPKIKELWETRKNDLLISADDMLERIKHSKHATSSELSADFLDSAYQMLEENYDENYGGFGSSPKFPVSHNLIFLMKYSQSAKNVNSLKMSENTLSKMGMGGIYDQIGFGFHRYSTDRVWLVPHFEKMLYDQALLAIAYTEAWQNTNNDEFRQKVYEILSYVERELTSVDGGFYCAEDADSDGEEGKFYLWNTQELGEILKEDFEIAEKVFSIKEDGNFHDERTGKYTGQNILHLTNSLEEMASELGISKEELKVKIEKIRRILFEEREKRIHPFKDEKILTDWNGLMMSAYAYAGKVFKEQNFVDIAIKNHDFLRKYMKDEKGMLLHSYQNTITGNLDDYAFYTWGLLELYNATFKIKYLVEAVEIQEILFNHFWDNSSGGYFFTPDFAEDLIVRKKEIYDGAIPSGNSAQLSNLVRISKLTGNIRYTEYIKKQIDEFSYQVKSYPVAYTQFLCVFSSYINSSVEIVFVSKSNADIKPFIGILNKYMLQNAFIILKTEDNKEALSVLASYTKDMKMLDGKPTVYLCKNFSCEYPINDLSEFEEKLKNINN